MNKKGKTKTKIQAEARAIPIQMQENSDKKIQIREGTNLKEFAEIIGIKAKDLIEGLQNEGYTSTINTQIDEDLAKQRVGVDVALAGPAALDVGEGDRVDCGGGGYRA